MNLPQRLHRRRGERAHPIAALAGAPTLVWVGGAAACAGFPALLDGDYRHQALTVRTRSDPTEKTATGLVKSARLERRQTEMEKRHAC